MCCVNIQFNVLILKGVYALKHIVYYVGVLGIAFVLMASCAVKMTFASGCCSKEACAAEKSDTKCVVCGKAIDKDKGVKVECEGKAVILCCKDCEAVFKKDPCKFCKDEKCEKRQGEAKH